jgi:hypothetical protein
MTRKIRTSTRTAALATVAAVALAGCAGGGDNGDVEVPIAEDQGANNAGGNEGGGNEGGATGGTVSIDLTLASVGVREVNLDDEREEFVDYCFGGSINDVGDGGAFGLLGFDSKQTMQASSVRLDEDDDRCVVVGYEAGTDVSDFTLGTVQTGAVSARDGEVNVQDSASLGGGGAMRGGVTEAPELVRVTIDSDLDQARYFFDESELSEGNNAAAFGFYTLKGEPQTANEVVSVEDDQVVVQFDEGRLEDAVRFFVESGGVRDQQGSESVLGADSRRTAAPDLVGVTEVSPSEYDFRFDEPVEGENGNGFFLYTGDGQSLTGSTVTRPAPEVARVVFRDAMDISDKIVRAAVGQDAVSSLDTGETGNTIGAALLGDAGGQGPTSGPDLIGVELDAAAGRVIFTFDATLTEDSPSPEGFSLITDSGDTFQAREIVDVVGGEVTGNTVIVLFDESSVEAAELASVSTDAVQDQQGNPNPVATTAVG